MASCQLLVENLKTTKQQDDSSSNSRKLAVPQAESKLRKETHQLSKSEIAKQLVEVLSEQVMDEQRNVIAHYTGQKLGGQFYGQGLLKFASGIAYRGKFRNGMFRDDQGEIYNDETKLTGKFRAGRLIEQFRTNHWKITDFDKSSGSILYIYEGQSQSYLPHGKGVLRYRNGDCCHGEFYYGEKVGICRYVSRNGEVYDGYYENDMKHGLGRSVSKKDIFQGEFQCDQRHGIGQVFYKEGQIISTGEWKSGIQDGLVTINFANGNNFEGQAKNHILEGYGILKNSKDEIIGQGQWKNQKLQKSQALTDSNLVQQINQIKGKFVEIHRSLSQIIRDNDMYYGKHLMNVDEDFYLDDILVGHYKGQKSSRQLYGKGQLTFQHGGYYEGGFKEDMFDGDNCKLYIKQVDKTYEGRFVQNKYILDSQSFIKFSSFGFEEYVYHGEMDAFVPNGLGTKIIDMSRSIEYYSGQFQNGLLHGIGRITTPYSTFMGNFQFEEKIGVSYEIFHDTQVQVISEYKKNKKQFLTIEKYANRDIAVRERTSIGFTDFMGLLVQGQAFYQGYFFDLKKQGYGIEISASGAYLVGKFSRDIFACRKEYNVQVSKAIEQITAKAQQMQREALKVKQFCHDNFGDH